MRGVRLNPQLPSIETLLFAEAKQPTLRLESWSNTAVGLLLRGFTKHGTFSLSHTTNSNRSIAYSDLRLPETPLILQITVFSGTPRRGSTYVRVSLHMAGFPVGVLLEGYMSGERLLSWPPGILESSLEPPGLLRSLSGTDPAAGAEVSETVPTNARWRLKAMKVTLVTNATVADRRVGILFDDGASLFFFRQVGATQAASLTKNYLFIIDHPFLDSAFDAYDYLRTSIPAIPFLQGWRIKTTTQNLQAGDNFGAPLLNVEEVIEE